MRTMIAIPCMDTVKTEFMSSVLRMRTAGEIQYAFAQNTLVYEGRQQLAAAAVAEGFERVLWLDSDMSFQADLYERLSARLDEGREIVSGLYWTRRAPSHPVIYRRLGHSERGGGLAATAEPFETIPENEMIPVEGVGMGCMMMSGALLRRVMERYGLPFYPVQGFGEDFSFCLRVRELGETIWCDTGLRCGHVGSYVYGEKTAGDS